MVYMKSVLKCIFAACVLDGVLQSLAYSKKHNSEQKVNKFIDILMASDKFEVMTDKLAEKAVEKMFKIQSNLSVTRDLKLNIKEPTHKKQHVTANINYPNKAADIHFRETNYPLKNLSLKYKYYTKAAYSDEDKEDLNLDELIETKTENSSDTQNMLQSNDESIDFTDLETSMQDRDKNSNKNAKSNHAPIETVKESGETKIIEEEDKQNESSISIENKKHDHLLFEKGSNLGDGASGDELSSGVISDLENNVKEVKDVINNTSVTSNQFQNKKPHKKRIHKEGKKLYTFQSSSDYEEYHQELEKVEKQRTIFV